MQTWETVFRNGFAPSITTLGLQVLAKGLEDDDPCITQGSTTTPPPLQCVRDWPVEATDPLGYTGWQTGLNTVEEVEEYFARLCFEADQRMGGPSECRWTLNFIDDTPRDEMRRELLRVVKDVLQQRLTQLPPAEVSPSELHPYELNAPLAGIRVDGVPVG